MKKKYDIYFYHDEEKKILDIISNIEKNNKLSDDDINFLNYDFRLSPLLSEYYERIAYHSDFKNRVKYLSKACSFMRVYSKIKINKNSFYHDSKKYNLKYLNDNFKKLFNRYSIQFSKRGHEMISRISYKKVKTIDDKKIISSYLNTKTASLLDFSHSDRDIIKAKKWNNEALSINVNDYKTFRVKARIYSIMGK